MRLTHLIILGSLATTASATEYVFQDFFVLKHPTGVAWNNTQLDVKLGKFASGFTPTLNNYSNWDGNFVTQTAGYYVGLSGGGPEFSTSLTLADNLNFAVNDQLWLLVQTPSGYVGTKETALFTDTAWRIVANSPTSVVTNFFQFNNTTSATFGLIDFAASTSGTVTVAAIPEPSTYGLGAGLVALAAVAVHRRRKKVCLSHPRASDRPDYSRARTVRVSAPGFTSVATTTSIGRRISQPLASASAGMARAVSAMSRSASEPPMSTPWA